MGNQKKGCRHLNIALLPQRGERLRCRQCHLTLKAEELERGYCPECYEASGQRRNDFEIISHDEQTKYRCEDCGAIIAYHADAAPHG
ncbi:MAG: hypothetical protein HKP58_13345 [Desulfatitalea sp.]|nr:hypothetical protein [Desulfatitalea sp.]NNK01385.1 hypothetical protein [Desulfatitalea sp.]